MQNVREALAKVVSMNPVTSSYIAAIGYDGDLKKLHVQFHTNKTYIYDDVPLEVYDGFLAAPSKGKYFAAEIRNKYVYQMKGEV